MDDLILKYILDDNNVPIRAILMTKDEYESELGEVND